MRTSSDNGVVLYFCYGRAEIFDQTLYSILSLLHVSPDSFRTSKVVIYTDAPERFAALPVETVALTDAQLDTWMGGSDYIHRRKTCVILDALSRYGGKVCFVDSDTYFTAPPERIFARVAPGRVCFHIAEGFIANTGTPFDDALARQLARPGLDLSPAPPVEFSPRLMMWNTGVVAIHDADRDALEEALALSDAIWRTADPDGPYGQKIHHAEQFATGYTFRNHKISEAADCVYHYWPVEAKRAFGAVLPGLVAAGLCDLEPANLARVYAARYREQGIAGWIDAAKMQLRKIALSLNIGVRGARRSIF